MAKINKNWPDKKFLKLMQMGITEQKGSEDLAFI